MKMCTVDNTDYTSTGKEPEIELKRLFVVANVIPENRLKIVKAGFIKVTDYAHIAMTDERFEAKILKMFPFVKDDDEDSPEVAAEKTRYWSAFSALWGMTKLAVDFERRRYEKIMEEPNKAPEIKDTDRMAQRTLYRTRHPDEVLSEDTEPHPKFVDTVYKDATSSSACVKDYAVGDIRLRGETIETESGLSKSLDKVIIAIEKPKGVRCISEEEVIKRLSAFFIALEFLQICDFTKEKFTRTYVNKLNGRSTQG